MPRPQSLGRITVRDADRTGLLVTNRKGPPQMVTEGNAMTVLVDGKEAFGSAADDIEAATTSLDMTQLFVTPRTTSSVPPTSTRSWSSRSGRRPSSPLDPLPPGQEATPVPRPGDRRPERLVLDAARRKVAVRILLNQPVASFPEVLFWLLALPAAAAGVGTGAVWLVAMVMGAGVALFPVFIGRLLGAVHRDDPGQPGPGQRLGRRGAPGVHGQGPDHWIPFAPVSVDPVAAVTNP